MVWGSFGAVHLISLALAAGIIAGLYFWLRRCGAKTQTWVLGIFSLFITVNCTSCTALDPVSISSEGSTNDL